MRFTALDDWLRWQETLHPRAIDLGLERARSVLGRLQSQPPAPTVITVGGTNGKGSCVALLEAMLRAAGYRVGAYTSPHLLRYNERIRIDGVAVDDAALCQAFAAIDAARGAISLTYFEFGTLAALRLFRQAGVDVAVLEVGLGGRLDAVNLVDADAALVVSVALDHTDWLGAERDSIGYEKAGIYRPERPAICADPDPPPRLTQYAEAIHARLLCVNRDYQFVRTGSTWRWQSEARSFEALPLPTLVGDHQLGNAAAALMTLTSLGERLAVPITAIRAGLLQAAPPGRCQSIPGPVEWILDVAHNPHAAQALADYLRAHPCAGRTWAIIGLLADKDATGIIQALTPVIDAWYAITLNGDRGRSGEQLAALLHAAGARAEAADLHQARHAVQTAACPGDRIVVFGSFHTVAPLLASQPWLSHSPLPPFREA